MSPFPSNKAKPVTLRDEIHGDITFDSFVREVIDHESFQRLRYIKQLGLAEYVFPCATHTRFQHSLGAAYLAGQYFESLLESWQTNPFPFEGRLGNTEFFTSRTLKCVREVASHGPSREFWWRAATLAGMLHDVGHGPWSHSFENLDLNQDFSAVTGQMKGAVGAYFETLASGGARLHHEEISLIYLFQILSDLALRGLLADPSGYFAAISMLVNRKMASGGLQQALEKELEGALTSDGIRGGVDFHRLLRPLISGPFDVDRIDYIQRDARNCGVHIGGIEWRRLMNKVMPCLARHENDRGEPRDVVLVSSVKNQHILDDFSFSLFQMYAQVYLHPKIVGLEESIRALLAKQKPEKGLVVDFELHKSLSDEKFRSLLNEHFRVTGVDSILLRREGHTFRVASYPNQSGMDEELAKNGFSLIDTQDRPMMKDALGVFLYSLFKQAPDQPGDCFLQPWSSVSPIAAQFQGVHLSPGIWIRRDTSTSG